MDGQVTMPRKLWEHADPKSTQMWQFMQEVNRKSGRDLKTFRQLYDYSVGPDRAEFWAHLFSYSNFIHSGTYTRVVDESATIDTVPRWFEGVHLNFAENVLYTRPSPPSSSSSSSSSPTSTASAATTARCTLHKEDDKIAITEVREGGSEVRECRWGELRTRAAGLAAAIIETFVVWLATNWLGAIFSSSSTDMGVKGILQRSVQVNPKLVFVDDAAVYNGKTVDLRQKMKDLVAGLDECDAFTSLISIPRWAHAPRDISHVPKAETWAALLSSTTKPAPDFVHIAFHEPSIICFSSGTTGMPKAITHSVGGLMLSYFKEGRLHEDLGPETVGLQYTTTGWIMYLANAGLLLFGSRSVFYDGSPFVPDARVLVDIVADQGVTKFGTSPRWMLELARNGLSPRAMADLSRLKVVTCTGMVLSEQLFEWFYDSGFPASVQLGNISGGTDIAGCFGIMNPLEPLFVGGTMGPSLGTDARIFDATLPDGTPGSELAHGTPGELVAVKSFPNVPCCFWNDGDGDDTKTPGPKYQAAYFNRFPGVWAHGDFCVVHPRTGQITFLGRADGVLNPSGVRFGSAEIYGVIERRFADRVLDSLCVGQRRPQDQDENVLLFLLMKPGHQFQRRLVEEIKEAIRTELSKRHVPKYVFETPEIPMTINMKKVELPVKQIVSGHKITPSGTLANPQSLEYYYQFAKVEELITPKEKL
ncbi:acetoacetate-CoA ligase [Cryphonectria parasitica EP155]|uniref:Acetoacetate-CoA ligase n=1 Tax=Cryphonectria parasitica (strain ATCC 38755 / EP155) TaxID=660469 RepID=A0A9P4YDZ6_CRYP1|nr:acetoacetate-CoA ligase [Cryphonectria parasitica EP155]KAF3770835.1 acetoacetate-CoA ligase [Cryphonectria parasitica EP155]